ncbi:hypothetical protein [Absidia glauca]|uniref:Uncharacterized protein n=1 Tax=Absidia glauca TaxID=4829 RepID=A0A163MQ32_ABSGL|nr:hypothetical protein [Absidia glauca]
MHITLPSLSTERPPESIRIALYGSQNKQIKTNTKHKSSHQYIILFVPRPCITPAFVFLPESSTDKVDPTTNYNDALPSPPPKSVCWETKPKVCTHIQTPVF